MSSRGLLIATALFAAGCGGGAVQVTHVLTGPPLEEKSSEAPVPVFFNERPATPYREVAQLRARSRGDPARLDRLLDAVVARARELGADAIIVDLRAHYGTVGVDLDCAGRPHVPPSDRLNARVTAIVFTGAPAGPEPAAAGAPPHRPARCP